MCKFNKRESKLKILVKEDDEINVRRREESKLKMKKMPKL